MRFFCCLLLISVVLTAKTAKITYTESMVGQNDENPPKTIVITDGIKAVNFSDDSAVKLRDFIPIEKTYSDFKNHSFSKSAILKGDDRIFYRTDFDTLKTQGQTEITTDFMGFECKKIIREINSNKIEILYTQKAGVTGTPRLSFASVPGLILKITVNNNYEIKAAKIEWLKEAVTTPADLGREVSNKDYDRLITKSLVTEVKVFDHEQLSFGNSIQNPQDRSTETFHYSSGTVILKKVKLPVVAEGDQIFVELTEKSLGDAYDRAGTVFMIPTDRKQSFLDGLQKGKTALPAFKAANGKEYQGVTLTPDFMPLCEIMRFYTPFGVGKFNDKIKLENVSWQDSVLYKKEVTYLKSRLQGEVLLGVFIGNYDKGGHQVSLNFKYHPGSREISNEIVKKEFVLPLFNTLPIMEMAGQEYGTMFENDSLTVEFEVPENTENFRLHYITTGHGGWGGGDEFNPKLNEIIIDGKLVYATTPWRTDCGVYRSSNPASGNFWNGLSSSDLSRSGWCPGTVTIPDMVFLKNLKPGKHKMQVAIPIGAAESNSFSHWNISAVLTGDYK